MRKNDFVCVVVSRGESGHARLEVMCNRYLINTKVIFAVLADHNIIFALFLWAITRSIQPSSVCQNKSTVIDVYRLVLEGTALEAYYMGIRAGPEVHIVLVSGLTHMTLYKTIQGDSCMKLSLYTCVGLSNKSPRSWLCSVVSIYSIVLLVLAITISCIMYQHLSLLFCGLDSCQVAYNNKTDISYLKISRM